MPQKKQVFPEEKNRNIKYGGYFVIAAGIASIIQLFISHLDQTALYNLINNQTLENAVAWGNFRIVFNIFAVIVAVSYIMLSFSLLACGQKEGINFSTFNILIGVAAGISQIINSLYWAYVGFLTRDVGADILEMNIGLPQIIILVMMIISLVWLVTTAFAFIRIGRTINMTISTATGILLISSLISSFLFPLAAYLVIGIAFLTAVITLLRISKR